MGKDYFADIKHGVDKRKAIIAAIAIIVVAAGILGWSFWRKSVTAEQETREPETVQTVKQPKKQKAEKKEPEPEATPAVSADTVRQHGSEVASKLSSLAAYTVPGDQMSTYDTIAQHGKFNTSGLTDVENDLRDAIQTSIHWPDGHTSEENQQQIQDTDHAYAQWEARLWWTMGDGLRDTVDGLTSQLEDMETNDMPESCKKAPSLLDSKPDDIDSIHTEQEYVAFRDWMNAVTNQLDQCNADMSVLYAGQ